MTWAANLVSSSKKAFLCSDRIWTVCRHKECRIWTGDNSPPGPGLVCGHTSQKSSNALLNRMSKHGCGRPANVLMSSIPVGNAPVPAVSVLAVWLRSSWLSKQRGSSGDGTPRKHFAFPQNCGGRWVAERRFLPIADAARLSNMVPTDASLQALQMSATIASMRGASDFGRSWQLNLMGVCVCASHVSSASSYTSVFAGDKLPTVRAPACSNNRPGTALKREPALNAAIRLCEH